MKRRLISMLLLAAMLSALFCVQPVYAVNSVQKTDDEIITATMTYLNIKEGNCNSVNANDMGAVSIGMIQWHGTRALELLKKIVALIPEYALEVLGEEFYNEILTAKNWETRVLTKEEKAVLVVLLSTDESRQVQVEQARADIGTYLTHAKKMGLNTPALQLYFMDIENQYGSGGAERMLKYAKEASGLSKFDYLTQFHNGMRKAAYQLEYNNSVTPYMSRRESTYSYIVETLKWETDVPYCIMTARCGADGDTHVSFEVKNGSFTFPENPYTREGYIFVGWNMHRQPSNTWYIANIGWCSAKWIVDHNYTKALYQPGQTQAIDAKFLSSGNAGSAYLLEPVWEEDETAPNTDCPDCPGSRFTDMPAADHWAHKGLDFCIERGLIKGTSDTTVSPDAKMTRAELVSVLYRVEGSPTVSGSSGFTDVQKGSWYENAVIWASICNIVSGTGNDQFSPSGTLTREQIASILYRYAKDRGFDITLTAKLDGYPDSGKISSWAVNGMKWAVGTKLISGKQNDGKTLLDPLGNATRAEVAAILMRLIQFSGA